MVHVQLPFAAYLQETLLYWIVEEGSQGEVSREGLRNRRMAKKWNKADITNCGTKRQRSDRAVPPSGFAKALFLIRFTEAAVSVANREHDENAKDAEASSWISYIHLRAEDTT